MAEVQRKRTLVNPARKKKRRNARKMSAKQIAIFGSKRQKAALKASRKRKKRNPPKRRHSTARKAAPRKRRAPRRTNRTRSRHRSRRRNPGGIVEVALNPAPKRRKAVAKTKRRRKSTSRRRHNRRRNPAPVTHRRRRRASSHRRTNRRRTHRRSNPSRASGSISNFLLGGASAAGGFIATKAATQFALGTSNTGIMGYVGNLAAAFILGKGVGMFTKNKTIESGFMIGGALVVVARLLSDQTPLGATLQQYGLGDYEASTWLSPARYIDAAKSAAVDIPTALRPQMVAAPKNGMAGLSSGTYGRGRGTY